MADIEYAVLGIHGEDVTTVNEFKDVLDDEGNPVMEFDGVDEVPARELVEERNVVRVRMFVDGKMIDEDFNLPRLITIEEQIEQAVKDRITEINKRGTDPKLSDIIPEQTEQIIVDEATGKKEKASESREAKK